MHKIKPIFKVVHNSNTNKTSLKGFIKARFHNLNGAFGSPGPGDLCEISGIWRFVDDSGALFCLYDWRRTDLYSPQLPLVSEFRAYRGKHIFRIESTRGGNIFEFIKWLREKLGYDVQYRPATDGGEGGL